MVEMNPSGRNAKANGARGVLLLALVLAACAPKSDEGRSTLVPPTDAGTAKSPVKDAATTDGPLLPSDKRAAVCGNSCITGFLAHGIGLEVGESADFAPKSRGFDSLHFHDGSDWSDHFNDAFVKPYFKLAGLNDEDFDVGFTPEQNRQVFARGFELKNSGPQATAEFDDSGNFLIHSFASPPTGVLRLNLSKTISLAMKNRVTGTVRYQCMVLGAEASLTAGSPGEVWNLGKIHAFYFYYTRVLRPCLTPVDLETIAIVDPLLGGFTAVPDGQEMTGVDTGPDIYFTQAAHGISNTTAGVMKFRSTIQGVKYRCKFVSLSSEAGEEGAFADCDGHYDYDKLKDGQYALMVRSYNELGTGMSVATAFFEVDTRAPPSDFTLTPSATPEAGSNLYTINVAIGNAPDRSTFLCAYNDSKADFCPATMTVAHLPSGVHRVTVQPIDAAGNAGKTRYLYLDVGASPLEIKPANSVGSLISFNATQRSHWNVRHVSYAFGSVIAGMTFRCVVVQDSDIIATKESCKSPVAFDLTADGAYSLRVSALDPSGTAVNNIEHDFDVDTIAPTTSDWSLNCASAIPASGGPSGTYDRSCHFVTSLDDADFSCRLNGGSLFDCASPFVLASLPSGTHYLAVTAIDQAGNSATAQTLDIQIP